jgi:hypothetical protein
MLIPYGINYFQIRYMGFSLKNLAMLSFFVNSKPIP